MKILLYILAALWFMQAILESSAVGDSAIRAGAAGISWLSCFVCLGSAAICGRLDQLIKQNKATGPSEPEPAKKITVPGINDR